MGLSFCLGSSLARYSQVACFFWHLLFFHLLGAALLIDKYDCAEDDDFSADAQERPEGGELICSTTTIFFSQNIWTKYLDYGKFFFKNNRATTSAFIMNEWNESLLNTTRGNMQGERFAKSYYDLLWLSCYLFFLHLFLNLQPSSAYNASDNKPCNILWNKCTFNLTVS